MTLWNLNVAQRRSVWPVKREDYRIRELVAEPTVTHRPLNESVETAVGETANLLDREICEKCERDTLGGRGSSTLLAWPGSIARIEFNGHALVGADVHERLNKLSKMLT